MFVVASDTASKWFRDVGNARYHSSQFFEALIWYNKSLCFAESKKVRALSYADRSAVYLEAKKYHQCLDNIQLARDHEYPPEEMSALNERKEKCMALMKHHHPDVGDNPWKFFKLSYPENKKLPFMVDCLELKTDSKYGRQIVTNRDLKPGDIIAIEEPFLKHLYKSHCYHRCNKCLKSNLLSLIPCEGQCIDTMYCSKYCMDQDKKYHSQYECMRGPQLEDCSFNRLLVETMYIAGSLKKLEKSVEKGKANNVTIFDLNKTNFENPQEQLQMFLSLKAGSTPFHDLKNELATKFSVQNRFKHLWKTRQEFELLCSTFLQLVKICNTNSFAFFSSIFKDNFYNREAHGAVVCLFGSFYNHSCSPNVGLIMVDNKVASVVSTPIKAGEQLFICYYLPFYVQPSTEKRQAKLYKDYNFKCDCLGCNMDSKFFDLETIAFTNTLAHLPFVKLKNPINELEQACHYIQKFPKNRMQPKNYSTFIILSHLLYLMASFGSLEQ